MKAKHGEIKAEPTKQQIRLSPTDQKMIQELLLDSRISASNLGKLVHLSPTSTINHINNLIKKGVINQFITIPNLIKANYKLWYTFLDIPLEQEGACIQSLIKFPNTLTIIKTTGKYNLIVGFAGKNFSDLDKGLTIISKHAKARDFMVLSVKEMAFKPYKLFEKSKKEKSAVTKQTSKDNISLTKLDKLLLRELSHNARENIANISYKIKSPPETIVYRLKKLRENGVIERFFTNINIFSFGFQGYILTIKILNKEIQNEVFDFIKNHPRTNGQYLLKESSWNILSPLIVKDAVELKLFIDELQKRFGKDIISYETTQILSQEFYDPFPKGLLI